MLFWEVFLPVRGRIVRGGTSPHFHMVVFERFNKLVRALLTQVKSPAIHLMLLWRRLNMVEIQRISMPLGYFPTVPESSSVLGVLRSEGDLMELGPAYIRVHRVIRLVGRMTLKYLSSSQLQMLHICFLEDHAEYALAHQKLRGVFSCRYATTI